MNKIVIVGAGIAGLSAALWAKKSGAEVSVVCKSFPTRAQSCMAQGGINAVLHSKEGDSFDAQSEDIMRSSHKLASKQSVLNMCQKAPDAIAWLDSIGVPFNRTEDQEIAQRRLGGTAFKRACYAQDFTGLKILHTLFDACNKEGIIFINEHLLLNVIVEEACARGITMLDIRSGAVKELRGDAVVLATGGMCRLYGKHSTNSKDATGDGVAAALRAGARLSNMEFIQFHPTALKSSSALISESARGAGGKLVNEQGERFVDERLTRDEVSRAIQQQFDDNHQVFLDITHLGEAWIEENLPHDRKLSQLYEGVDPVHEKMPIKPAAHYSMGGIDVDENSHTTLNGLYACGECANHHVHGANRLGGNSLLEAVVFGMETGINVSKHESNATEGTKEQFEKDSNFIKGVKRFTNQIDFYEKRNFLENIFYHNVGVKRNDDGLKAVLSAIRQLQMELPFMGVKDKSDAYNTNLVDFIEFGNILELSEVIVVNATMRKESRGAHYREDEKVERDEEFGAKSIVWKEDGVICADFERVV